MKKNFCDVSQCIPCGLGEKVGEPYNAWVHTDCATIEKDTAKGKQRCPKCGHFREMIRLQNWMCLAFGPSSTRHEVLGDTRVLEKEEVKAAA